MRRNTTVLKAISNRPNIYKLLHSIKNPDVKNLIRGILADTSKTIAPINRVNQVRKLARGRDLCTASELIFGKSGAFPFSNTRESYKQLDRRHALVQIPTESELLYLIGHINGWEETAKQILISINILSALTESDHLDAMTSLEAFANQWGASNYLAKKIAYISSLCPKNIDVAKVAHNIGKNLKQSTYSAPYFSAIEAIDTSFPLFSVVSKNASILKKHVDGDFRNLLHLHNIVPTPIGETDLSYFLRSEHSKSLVDELVALVQVMHLSDSWPEFPKLVETHLNESVFVELGNLLNVSPNFENLCAGVREKDTDMAYYRRSMAFLEFKETCRFRNCVDAVIGRRFLPGLVQADSRKRSFKSPTANELTTSLNGFNRNDALVNIQASCSFLRTFWFLVFLENPESRIALQHHQIRFIFENTIGLDFLLSEAELERLYATCDEESRPLVTVLALALHKAKSNDEDVDFKFRLSLAQIVKQRYHGDILKFISWLLPNSPQIANFLLDTLSSQTLQKIYWLIDSPDQAADIRQQMLRLVGQELGRIEYYVEADSIEAQRQVSKLRKYFDDSRMFVDSISMKQWLVENPSAYTQQYLRLLETNSTKIAKLTINSLAGEEESKNKFEIKLLPANDYILFEIVKVAFNEFCTNANFGIESYLGRRIRHNTLTGMMRGGLEAIVDKPKYSMLKYDEDFILSYNAWIDTYRKMLERIRREILQFRSKKKPAGIFNSELKDDLETTARLAKLRGMLGSANNTELFYELVIRVCWQIVDPQLISAARFIRGNLLNEALASLNQHLDRFDESVQSKFRMELLDAIHERFERLASWFRIPDSGFVSVNTKKLGNLIFMEAKNVSASNKVELLWSGDAYETVLDGLSVHRMYDCLTVLIQNAFDYSQGDSDVAISASFGQQPTHNIGKIRIEVSTISPSDQSALHRERLTASFVEGDLSNSMAREGYSGIKKVRFITQNSEGVSTVSHQFDGDCCTISFELTVELSASPEDSS